MREQRPFREGRVGRRRAELAILEILRPGDAATLAADDGVGRPVVEHEHRLDRRRRILIVEPDQRIDVAEDDVTARRKAVDRVERPRPGVDRHVQPLVVVIALVGGHQGEYDLVRREQLGQQHGSTRGSMGQT